MGSRGKATTGETNIRVSSLIRAEINNVPHLTSERCIYRVPARLREANPKAYIPELVSIGPFHHGAQHLQTMEHHKLHYLRDYVNRGELKYNIEHYIENLGGLEERARQFYGEPISLTRDEFVKMMLVDSCFIIEIMVKTCVKGEPSDSNDPMFNASWMRDTVIEDMKLIENQLPFFVMEHLFNLVNGPEKDHWDRSFLHLTCDFLRSSSRMSGMDIVPKPDYQVKHFVDLLRQSYAPSTPRTPSPRSKAKLLFIPSATELQASGIRFTKGSSKYPLDISFTNNGVLNIPPVTIGDGTETLFRNLIAFEHFDEGPSYVTNYAQVMDCLINTPDDVALLRQSEIVDRWLGNDEEVSFLFNNICKGAVTSYHTSYYTRIFQEVNAYYKKRWNVWRAKLITDYFNTPWSTISFVAAFVLLVCTIVQTLYVIILA